MLSLKNANMQLVNHSEMKPSINIVLSGEQKKIIINRFPPYCFYDAFRFTLDAWKNTSISWVLNQIRCEKKTL